jgi:hypothetical protein
MATTPPIGLPQPGPWVATPPLVAQPVAHRFVNPDSESPGTSLRDAPFAISRAPSMASPYQSPTKRLKAEIVTDDGGRVVGDLHLHPNTLAPGGYESVLTMMNNPEPFFPVSEGNETVALVGKRRTVSVSYGTTGEAPTSSTENRVRLEALLSDGRTLSGWAILDLPSSYPRTLDLLNGPGLFLPIDDGTRMHLVNRVHIRTVHPLD